MLPNIMSMSSLFKCSRASRSSSLFLQQKKKHQLNHKKQHFQICNSVCRLFVRRNTNWQLAVTNSSSIKRFMFTKNRTSWRYFPNFFKEMNQNASLNKLDGWWCRSWPLYKNLARETVFFQIQQHNVSPKMFTVRTQCLKGPNYKS